MLAPTGHEGTSSIWTVETGLKPVTCGDAPCERVMCVGTNPQRLLEIQRRLDCDLDFVIATCPVEGLAALEVEAPFHVIITCLPLRMKQGTHFQARLREHSPNAERLVLAPRIDANARAMVATDARVMRLLRESCPTSEMREAVADALLRHRARCLRAAIVPRFTPPGGNPCAG